MLDAHTLIKGMSIILQSGIVYALLIHMMSEQKTPIKNKSRRGIYIPEPMHADIMIAATGEGISISEWIRDACRRKIDGIKNGDAA